MSSRGELKCCSVKSRLNLLRVVDRLVFKFHRAINGTDHGLSPTLLNWGRRLLEDGANPR
jgi:hypothetical protein